MIVVVLRGIEENELGESTLVVMVRNIDWCEGERLTELMRSRTQALNASMMRCRWVRTLVMDDVVEFEKMVKGRSLILWRPNVVS